MNTLTEVGCQSQPTQYSNYNRKHFTEQHDTERLYKVFEDDIPQKPLTTLPPINPRRHKVYEYLNLVSSKEKLVEKIENTTDTIQLRVNFDVDAYKLADTKTEKSYREFVQRVENYLKSAGVRRIQRLYARCKGDYSSVHLRFKAECNSIEDANYLNSFGKYVQKRFKLDTVNPLVGLTRAEGVERLVEDDDGSVRIAVPYAQPYLSDIGTEQNNLECVKRFVDTNAIEIVQLAKKTSKPKLSSGSITSTDISDLVDMDNLLAGNLYPGYEINSDRIVSRDFSRFPRGCEYNHLLQASETLSRTCNVIKKIKEDISISNASKGSKRITEDQRLFYVGLSLARSFGQQAVLPLSYLADILEPRACKIVDDVIKSVRESGEKLQFTLLLNNRKSHEERVRDHAHERTNSHAHKHASDLLTGLLHNESVTVKPNKTMKKAITVLEKLGLVNVKVIRKRGWILTQTSNTCYEVLSLARDWVQFCIPDTGMVRSANPTIIPVHRIRKRLNEEKRFQRECRQTQTMVVKLFEKQDIRLGSKTWKNAA